MEFTIYINGELQKNKFPVTKRFFACLGSKHWDTQNKYHEKLRETVMEVFNLTKWKATRINLAKMIFCVNETSEKFPVETRG